MDFLKRLLGRGPDLLHPALNNKIVGSIDNPDELTILLPPVRLSHKERQTKVIDCVRIVLKTRNTSGKSLRDGTGYLYLISHDETNHAILTTPIGNKKPGEEIHVVWELPFENYMAEKWHAERRTALANSERTGVMTYKPAITMFMTDGDGTIEVDCSTQKILDPGSDPNQGYRRATIKQHAPATEHFPAYFANQNIAYPEKHNRR